MLTGCWGGGGGVMVRMKGEGKSVGVGRREGMVAEFYVGLLLGLSRGMMGMGAQQPSNGQYGYEYGCGCDKVRISIKWPEGRDAGRHQEQEQATAKLLVFLAAQAREA